MCNRILWILLFLISFSWSINSWTLTQLNISDFTILHVSVYFSRAFLSIKHNQNSSNEISSNLPTLIETSWPEDMIGIKPKIFPSEKLFKRRIGKCRNIIQAVATDLDMKGRLWLIDNGSSSCYPKLIIYDLLYRNEEIQFSTLNMNEKKFSALVVDHVLSEDEDARAYLSLHDEEYLLIYSFNQKKFGKLKFIENAVVSPPRSYSFSEMVIAKENLMYLADSYTGNLFTLNMTPLRFLNFSFSEKKKISIKSPLSFVGMLLGQPKGLSIHPKGYLFYILPRDGAVVMWDPRTPLLAEWHEVIYQSNHNFTQLLFGQKGNVYAISESSVKTTYDAKNKHCIKISIE